MSRRFVAAGVLSIAVLVVVPASSAKDFGPGDLRVCNAARCEPLTRPPVVRQLGPFYYSGGPLTVSQAPRLGAPAYELRFKNGYATGIVASPRLDRFLSYGVHLGRFRRDTWYRLPAAISRELARLTAGMKPMRVTRAALEKSR
jgi:hypothetical protein